VTSFLWPSVRRVCIGTALSVAALLTANMAARASATVTCTIDDTILKFDLEASAGRDGPIMRVNAGRFSIKPAARSELAGPDVSFDQTNIVQQWILGDDMRLQIEVGGNLQTINLTIMARFDKRKDKYFGNYVLTLGSGGKSKILKGRIKECEAG
jgi:hypothetical protein